MGHTVLAGGIADGIDLVFHEGDEGGDDNGGALADHGRQLIAEGLATPGRHNDKGVLATQNTIDNGLLVTFKVIKTKYFF